MKRIFIFALIILTFVLTFVGCDKDNQGQTENTQNPQNLQNSQNPQDSAGVNVGGNFPTIDEDGNINFGTEIVLPDIEL